MKAAVFSIGTELTRGELINGNAAWLSDQLTALGCEVVEHCVVPDQRESIATAVLRLADGAQLVVATGGLGPTSDDMTAVSVAAALGVPLQRDHASVERIRRVWAARGKEMPASNLSQAEVPEGAEVIPNEVGTAPAFAVTRKECKLFFLPGVPREMEDFFARAIVPHVRGLVTRTQHQVHLRCFGIPESEAADLLVDIEERFPRVTLGYRARFPELEIKILASGNQEAEARKQSELAAEEVTQRLGDAIFGGRKQTFAGAVGRILRARGKTLAVAESCTGGMLGSMLTSVPGSSDYLLLDAVCYSNASKVAVLGVPDDILRSHGAVSEETAEAMADGARRVAGADLAVSVTGIAGPGGGTEKKPVGTIWIGLSRDGQPTHAVHHSLPWDRERIRVMASYLALRMVARAAEGKPFT